MLPQNKSNIITDRNFENSQYVNPIEDGNTPLDNPNQGVLVTTELNTFNGYSDAYEPIVTEFSKVSEINGILTYKFTVSYTIHNIDGYYGNNLFKNGDPFTLVNLDSGLDFDYVKGYIISSSLNDEFPISGNTLYYFDLICVITEGSPDRLIPGGGQIIKLDRRMYVDENSLINQYPINLNSSQDPTTSKVYFNWTDETNLAVGYRLNIRSEYPTDNGSSIYNIERLFGNFAKFNGLVEPLLYTAPGFTDTFFSHKIVDRGRDWSLLYYEPRYINNVGVIMPTYVFFTDVDGGLQISEYQFIEGSSYGGPFPGIAIKLKKLSKLSYTGYLTEGMYVDLGIPGVDGAIDYIDQQDDTTASISIVFRDFNIPFIDDNDLKAKLKNKTIKIHSGIFIFYGDPFISGFTKDPIISYDKYPDGTNFVLPIDYFNGPGTYYWSIASVFDYEQKNYTRWSEEQKLIIQ